MLGEIEQEIILRASPEKVYRVLTDSEHFTAIVGVPAEIDPGNGGSFALFDGMIVGYTLEAIPTERLVQAWRVRSWPEGVFSVVRFELVELDEVTTRISLVHAGFPLEQEQHLASGWHQNYWEPMARTLVGSEHELG